MKGQEIFLERTDLRVASNGWLALFVVSAVVVLSMAFFRAFDGMFFGATLVSQVIVIGLGLALITGMILGHKSLKKRWGERAFSIAFRWLAIPGLTLVLSGVAHFAFIEGQQIVPRECAFVPGAYLLITGALLWVRAVMVFGVDNLSLLYIYFPGEGQLVNADIYNLIRHPVYSAVLRIALALVLFRGSALALFAGVMSLLSMRAWVYFVEERELLERFGADYEQYRTSTPAFFNLNPAVWPRIWRFIAIGA